MSWDRSQLLRTARLPEQCITFVSGSPDFHTSAPEVVRIVAKATGFMLLGLPGRRIMNAVRLEMRLDGV